MRLSDCLELYWSLTGGGSKHRVLNPALYESTVCFLDRSASRMGVVPDPEVFPNTFALAI